MQLYSLNLKQGQNFILLTKMLTIGAKLANKIGVEYNYYGIDTKKLDPQSFIRINIVKK